jgi:uncharacterized protein
MLLFSRHIAEKWNLSEPLAKEICLSFEKGLSAYYLNEYHPAISAEVDGSLLHEIFDYLRELSELVPKKKRLINALSKAGKLPPEMENRINAMTNAFELDDMLVPHRLNPRSRAQLALQAGLGKIADIVEKQEESAPLEDLAQEFVGSAAFLKKPDDVVNAVKDILVERFSSDETVRTMVRDFGYEEASFELIGKKKGKSAFGDFVKATDVVGEKLLELMVAEDRKQMRLKLTIQLFRITELLKQHFITNPDSPYFDFLSSVIDECWLKVLQPFVERDVKMRLRSESEALVMRTIIRDIEKGWETRKVNGIFFAIGQFAPDIIIAVALDPDGHLAGATTIKGYTKDKQGCLLRFRQFATRHRPSQILIVQHDPAAAPTLATALLADAQTEAPVSQITADPKAEALTGSEWMLKRFSDLDVSMQKIFAAALCWLQPIILVPEIGLDYFTIHSFQELVNPALMCNLIKRKTGEMELRKGIVIGKIADSMLEILGMVPEKIIEEFRKRDSNTPLASKENLLMVPGMTETTFKNIAGFVIVPNGPELLDRTLVHPDHFEWLQDLCAQLEVSLDALISDPDILRSAEIEDYVKKIFIEKKLIEQVRAGQRYLSQASSAPRRKLKLTELVEGTITTGRVTNVTPFGVFVDINAVCDGLIHISQLADGYVQSADQVVSVNDRVNVRIVKIDAKKRRISLSMKNLGHLAPKVRPSKDQLSTLADHFKNR